MAFLFKNWKASLLNNKDGVRFVETCLNLASDFT